MTHLLSVTYTSRSLVMPGEPAFAALARTCVLRNKANQVTGALYFNNHTFLQVLEGVPDKMEALLKDIRKDPRHSGFKELLRTRVRARLFSRFSMRFLDGRKEAVGPLEASAAPERLARANIGQTLAMVFALHNHPADRDYRP